MNFDPDLTSCAALVEKGDPDRFAAAMASPLEARRVLFPLYAFNVEVSRAPWVTQEPMIAEMRLQWWRDALEEIASGTQIRRHEVVTPLSKILKARDTQQLDKLVAARRWDIYKEAFEDETHLDTYLTDTAGSLMCVAARSLSASAGGAELDEKAKASLHDLGKATALARFLQAVPALEAQGRIPLLDGRPEAVTSRAQQALASMPTRYTLRKTLPIAAQPAMTEAFLTRALLKQAADDPARVGAGALAVHPVQRSIRLWLWS